MISNDNQQYITVELFRSEMNNLLTQIRLENEKLRGELRKEFQDGFSTLHTEIEAVKEIAIVNSARIDMLQHSLYWGFAIMTIVIAVVAIFVPYFLHEHKEKKQEQEQQQYTTRNEVQELIAQALDTRKATM